MLPDFLPHYKLCCYVSEDIGDRQVRDEEIGQPMRGWVQSCHLFSLSPYNFQ